LKLEVIERPPLPVVFHSSTLKEENTFGLEGVDQKMVCDELHESDETSEIDHQEAAPI
jgi:hypothetical protein